MEMGRLIEADFNRVTTRKQKIGDAARKEVDFQISKSSGGRTRRAERLSYRAMAELSGYEEADARILASILFVRGGVVIDFPQPPAQHDRLTQEGE